MTARYQWHQRMRNLEIKDADEEYKSKEVAFEKCASALRRATQTSNTLLSQANEYEKQASKIQKMLYECYAATNIIPPDYRYIDCVIVINHVFRNDLADTVRDAIFYYEEKQFRGMVLRGINNIYQMLGKMATVLADVRKILNDISYQVSDMSADLQSAAESQAESLRINKAGQYAQEAFYASQREHNQYVANQMRWNS